MNADLDETLNELGPAYRSLVARLQAAPALTPGRPLAAAAFARAASARAASARAASARTASARTASAVAPAAPARAGVVSWPDAGGRPHAGVSPSNRGGWWRVAAAGLVAASLALACGLLPGLLPRRAVTPDGVLVTDAGSVVSETVAVVPVSPSAAVASAAPVSSSAIASAAPVVPPTAPAAAPARAALPVAAAVASTAPRAASPYALALAPTPAARAEILRTQEPDGSWRNDFLTRQNAAALRDVAGADIAYRKAVRYLRTKGLAPLTAAELRARRLLASRR